MVDVVGFVELDCGLNFCFDSYIFGGLYASYYFSPGGIL